MLYIYLNVSYVIATWTIDRTFVKNRNRLRRNVFNSACPMKMYKLGLLLFFSLFFSGRSYSAPGFELTVQGMVNSENKSPYVIVDFPGHDRAMLLQSLRNYVQKYWNKPSESLKIQGDFVSISYYQTVPVGAKKGTLEGTMNIEVKNDKVRMSFNLVALYRRIGGAYYCYNATRESCPSTYETMGGGHAYYARRGIFDKEGKLKYPEQKKAIEDYVNQEVKDITDFINTQSSDW